MDASAGICTDIVATPFASRGAAVSTVPFGRRKVTDPVGTYAPAVTAAVIRTAVPTRAVAGIVSVVTVGARAIDTDEDDDVAA